MAEIHDKTAEYVLDVLESADDPLSVGQIQQRIADEGFDATTSAITDACETLREDGKVKSTGDPPNYYRVADVDESVRQHVRSVLESSDGPLSAGQIQQRIADEGLDVTTGTIDTVCSELVITGELVAVEDSSQRRYRTGEESIPTMENSQH